MSEPGQPGIAGYGRTLPHQAQQKANGIYHHLAETAYVLVVEPAHGEIVFITRWRSREGGQAVNPNNGEDFIKHVLIKDCVLFTKIVDFPLLGYLRCGQSTDWPSLPVSWHTVLPPGVR